MTTKRRLGIGRGTRIFLLVRCRELSETWLEGGPADFDAALAAEAALDLLRG